MSFAFIVLFAEAQRERERVMRVTMGGGERKKILVGLAVAMFLGVAVYLRLWTIDYSFSSDDSEILRFFFPFCFFSFMGSAS